MKSATRPAPAKLTRVAAAAAVVVAMVLLAPLSARAQVLQHVPSDALVAVKINKLKPVSDKIAAFSQKLQLNQLQPGFADPLGHTQKQLGLTQGVDPQGEAAIVLVNGPMNEKQPPLLVLVPVTDYQAFLKNFQDPRQEDQFTIVKLKGDNDDSFVMKRGNYAAISPKRDYLQAKAEGLKPTGLAAKQVEEKDIVAFVNMKSARARILPELQKNRAKILAEFEKGFKQAGQRPGAQRRPGAPQQGPGGLGEPPAAGGAGGAAAAGAGNAREKFLPLFRSVINRALDVAEQVITDADAATYGWTFAEAGIQATGVVEFAADSPSAQRVGQLKNSGEPVLAGLPAGKYWLFGGSAGNNADVVAKMINEFLAPIDPQLAAMGADGKPMQDYLNAVRTYVANIKGQSVGWLAPQGLIGQEAVFQMVSVQRGDADKLIEAQRQMFNSQQVMMQAFGGMPAGAEIKTSYTANAKTIDGVQLNLMSTTFAPPAGQRATPQQMQMQQMMNMMYGPGGMNAYVGALGEDKIVGAMGASDATLQQLVASAKAGTDVLGTTKAVQATDAQLPKERLGAWYVSIDQIASSAAAYAKAFGMPIKFNIPQNLSPLGAAVSSQGNALRMDGYAPTQTLQSVIAGVMETYMQMQGGQQPGGPGDL